MSDGDGDIAATIGLLGLFVLLVVAIAGLVDLFGWLYSTVHPVAAYAMLACIGIVLVAIAVWIDPTEDADV